MTDFDLSAIPQLVNDAIFAGDNLVAAQLVLSVVMIFIVMLPMMMSRQKPEIMLAFTALIVFVETAIGWLESYMATVIILVVAAMMAKTMAKYIGG